VKIIRKKDVASATQNQVVLFCSPVLFEKKNSIVLEFEGSQMIGPYINAKCIELL
jgi:hypothetical protein